MIIVPTKIHTYIEVLCNKIVPNKPLQWVAVNPEFGAELNECFFNVAQKVKRDGGSIQHGWCIWERPGLFVEGEFHAVWISPNGDNIDITPKSDQEERILFLPDPDRVFNESTYQRIDNIRMAIKEHPIVEEFLDTIAEYNAWKESCSDPDQPQMMHLDAATAYAYEKKLVYLEKKMTNLPILRNDICRCGSGKKDKKCCKKSS